MSRIGPDLLTYMEKLPIFAIFRVLSWNPCNLSRAQSCGWDFKLIMAPRTAFVCDTRKFTFRLNSSLKCMGLAFKKDSHGNDDMVRSGESDVALFHLRN